MKRIFLQKVVQGKVRFYLGKLPAKDLVRLATKAEFESTQEAQRPINKKRVEEIAEFVKTGSLSTSIVIGTKVKEKLSVRPVEDNSIQGLDLYYMDFPETAEEFELYKDTFDIMDGQHRLFAFLPEFNKLPDNAEFEMHFAMYIVPTLRERRMIFKNTNEKQKSVDQNLLLWFRSVLGMLRTDERLYHSVVELLNTESVSPLRGKIIMGSEKVRHGFKAKQVISILNKEDIIHECAYRPKAAESESANYPQRGDADYKTPELDDQKMLKLISEYLSGWEEAVGYEILSDDRAVGAFTKISGFRFMIKMLPEFYRHAQDENKFINKQYVSSTLKQLFAYNGMEPVDLFNPESQYLKNLGQNPFAGETPTAALAKDWSSRLKDLTTNTFDPLGF
ncbi:DGQHR domain-containing protein [Alloscardovia criceti]|uniref:DGQHR domain-containing protein n=1 Tax=Alloscardovia criceti TaxID=356828 RepID=UPI0003805F65|nr:DGQHR domain-containing protein [Alloscardovia criceti]